MDVAAIRLANLKFLVDRLKGPENRRHRDVAVDLDLSASFLSQLVGGKKMGDDVARKIEAARQLPHGWMDQPQWLTSTQIRESGPEYALLSHGLGISPEILAAAYQLVRLACKALEIPFDPETAHDSAIVLLGCTYLRTRKEQSVTVDNVVDFQKVLRDRMREGGAVEQRNTGIGSASAGTRRKGSAKQSA